MSTKDKLPVSANSNYRFYDTGKIFEVTGEEYRYLVQLLNQEEKNLLEDLSGADCVDISQTAVRLLNDDSELVEGLLKKLGQ
tara:strand:+ start:237 stop:482 length:246 start_codon:yes stop_codon:yes gene_type:complete